MMFCTVSVIGRDRQTHTLEVHATSLFDAVDQAMQQWALLWWCTGDELAEVRFPGGSWKVSFERVRAWRGTRARKPDDG